jgi:hypothetical protein
VAGGGATKRERVEMVCTEEKILFPLALQTLFAEEWAEVRRGLPGSLEERVVPVLDALDPRRELLVAEGVACAAGPVDLERRAADRVLRDLERVFSPGGNCVTGGAGPDVLKRSQ